MPRSGILLFVSLFLAFQSQRYFILPRLGYFLLPNVAVQFQSIVSGLLSDFWIATVLSLPLGLLISFFVSLFSSQSQGKVSNKFLNRISFFVAALMGLLIGSHITYVDFYGNLLNPMHLRYLGDHEFLSSNFDSMFDIRVLVTFIVALVGYSTGKLILSQSEKRSGFLGSPHFIILCVVVLGFFCQFMKVRLHSKPISWETPQHLKVNYLEQAIVQAFNMPSIAHLSMEEIGLLEKADASNSSFGESHWSQYLQDSSRSAETPLGVSLKERVHAEMRAQKPIYVFVVLLESLRPEDGKFHYPENPRSFTPFLDELAKSSVAFTNSYSVGGETRTGQEAVLCGLITGEYTSAMRDLLSLNPQCLPELLRKEYGQKVRSGWWHGGSYGFDNQGSFWNRHGVDSIVSRENFPDNAASTYWGVSDHTLFRRLQLDLQTQEWISPLVQFHTVLTISNHPAWSLPSDAPDKTVTLLKSAPHPGQATARYADDALNEFVTFLQETPCVPCEEQTFWERSLVVLVNDHGTLIPSQRFPNGLGFGTSAEEDVRAAVMRTKVGLYFSGGLVQDSLKKTGESSGIKIERLVNQADIFATLADLLGLRNYKSVSDSLFAWGRRHPLFSDLGGKVFFPHPEQHEQGWVVSRKELAQPLQGPPSVMQNAQVFFRAYQNLLIEGKVGR
jgi:phosphoglycerol transferase MdoB-like AlkP superfamily enzyme